MSTTTSEKQDWIGYHARDLEHKKSIRGRLGAARRWLTARAYDVFCLPHGLARHRALLQTVSRTQSYTYTCFFRAPEQLRTISGPVLEYLGLPDTGKRLEILIFAASNGAEAYTLASWLMQNCPELDFHITASDLHDHMVERCVEANYSAAEALQSEYITQEFVQATFDRSGDRYLVKPAIKAKTTFTQANLLDTDQLQQKFTAADIVLAQNVLFHLAPDDATVAFENCLRFLKPRAALLIEGMDADLRIDLTRKHELRPLTANQKRIYNETRVHTPPDWWNHYWGSEPYLPFRKDKKHRYGTIFLR
jgi:chemotaxis methyl-accepting protein methylase